MPTCKSSDGAFAVSAALRCYGDLNGHTQIAIGSADKIAGDRNCLTDVAGDRNANQVAAVDGAVGRVIRDPAGAWNIDIGPRVCRSGAACRAQRIIQITGYDPGAKAETSGRFDEEHRKIAT